MSWRSEEGKCPAAPRGFTRRILSAGPRSNRALCVTRPKVGTNLPLDWENLAEEVESLGRSRRHELRSRIAVILEHLIKLERSPAIDTAPGGWRRLPRAAEIELVLCTIARASRVDVARDDRRKSARVARLTSRAPSVVRMSAILRRRHTPRNKLLGDWYPGDPLAPTLTLPLAGEGIRRQAAALTRGACGRTRRPGSNETLVERASLGT